MMGIWRRIRGALGNAVIWSAGWVIGGLSLVSVAYPLMGISRLLTFFEYLAEFGLVLAGTFAAMGFVSGAAFSLYLGLAGRNKVLGELKPGRFAVAAAALSTVIAPVVAMLSFPGALTMADVVIIATASGALGAGTALGTIKLAQSALPSGGDSADRVLRNERALIAPAVEPGVPRARGDQRET